MVHYYRKRGCMNKNSTFTGSNWGLIWRTVVLTYGIVLTLFIAAPWLLAWYYKWYAGNMVVDGKKLEFTGTANDLFFIYGFIAITIFTICIGAIFMMAWFHRKIMEHVHFKQ